jgi:1,4-alpha-glucan branching enzyme
VRPSAIAGAVTQETIYQQRKYMSAKQSKPTRGSKTVNTTNKKSTGDPAPQQVHFEYRTDIAQKVCLVGSFNDWQPKGLEMISLGGGKWAKDLMLPPGTYEYQLVADGQWLADPGAAESIPNPFGGQNSVKVVTPVSAPVHTRLLAGASAIWQRALMM